MPIKTSAKKALRQSKKRRAVNLRRLKTMRGITKEVKGLILENKKEEAKKKLSLVYKAIDKTVKRGLIKKNTAARKKSRLAKLINKI